MCDLVVLLFAMTFPTLMAYLEFMVFPYLSAESGGIVQIVYPAGKAVQFLLPFLYVWWRDRSLLGWPIRCRDGLGLGIAFGIATGLAMFALYFGWLKHSGLFAGTTAQISRWLGHIGIATPAGYWAMALFISLLHSLLEEYYWRWFVFGWLKRHLPLGLAMVISGAGFMSHHVVVLAFYFPDYFTLAVVPFALGVAVGGIVWAWLYHRCNSIYAPWISHLLVDLAIMVVGYDLLTPFFQRL